MDLKYTRRIWESDATDEQTTAPEDPWCNRGTEAWEGWTSVDHLGFGEEACAYNLLLLLSLLAALDGVEACKWI